MLAAENTNKLSNRITFRVFLRHLMFILQNIDLGRTKKDMLMRFFICVCAAAAKASLVHLGTADG